MPCWPARTEPPGCLPSMLLPPTHRPPPMPNPALPPRRYGGIVLAVEILGGLAMLPYGLCLVMRVTNNGVPPPDDKGQARGEGRVAALRLRAA